MVTETQTKTRKRTRKVKIETPEETIPFETVEVDTGIPEEVVVDVPAEDMPVIEDEPEIEDADPESIQIVDLDDEDELTQMERDGETEAEEPKKRGRKKGPVDGPYAGLSPHQKNRRIVLEKYGERDDYSGNDFIIHLGKDLKTELLERMRSRNRRLRPSAKSESSDRFLHELRMMNWPEGIDIRIEYPDQVQERRNRKRVETEEQKARKLEQKLVKDRERAEKLAKKGEVKLEYTEQALKALDEGAKTTKDGIVLGIDVSESLGM